MNVIGPDKVSVPDYFTSFSIPGNRVTGGIGFILPNSGSSLPLQSFAVTIDSVEKFTGIDFFSALSDKQEKSKSKNPVY
ncbi:MAG: DNA/RNA non-specific endonuclease [Bacteroidales bacterium]|nr:DNA/RNA non-specific endonuclease [Bacteroidales bacterium]